MNEKEFQKYDLEKVANETWVALAGFRPNETYMKSREFVFKDKKDAQGLIKAIEKKSMKMVGGSSFGYELREYMNLDSGVGVVDKYKLIVSAR